MSRPKSLAISDPAATQIAGVVAHCRDLLAPLGVVRIRRMFGGHGIYVDELFIAIIADGSLYLKTDSETTDQFRGAGCQPFVYQAKGKEAAMSYWTAPEAAMEMPEAMRPWALLAIDAANRSQQSARRKQPK